MSQTLAELKRKFRLVEADRQKYSQETQKIIQKQTLLINRLKEENDTLRARVAAETRFAQSTTSQKQLKQLEELRSTRDDLLSHIEEARHETEAEQRRTKLLQRRLADARKERARVLAGRDRSEIISRQTATLENRLQQALVRLNTGLTKNRELRDQIESLRRERLTFDSEHSKLDGRLTSIQAEIAQLIAESNQCYQSRSQLQADLARLKEKGAREAKAFADEWRDLGRVLERQERAADARQAPSAASKSLSPSSGPRAATSEEPAHQMDEEQLTASMRLLGVGVEAGAVSSAQRNPTDDTRELRLMKQVLDSLADEAGVSGPEALAALFLQREDAAFSLYNYTNELKTEAESLEEEVSRLREQLAQAHLSKGSMDSQLREKCRLLEEQLASLLAQKEGFHARYLELSASITEAGREIAAIFDAIECEPLSTLQAGAGDAGAGSASQVTPSNIMQYLGAIELRSTELTDRLVAVKRAGLRAEQIDAVLRPQEELRAAGIFEGSAAMTPGAAELISLSRPAAASTPLPDTGEDAPLSFSPRPVSRSLTPSVQPPSAD
eukprot:gnl/Ergobibamus_cyprinoides/564.p1 GENE.gnl/Ergobibamus_cyprinoides/564~~gnl/Ergobibamus_cyprinoides/564.p1  ORF type:complete len:557 (-),score=179.00 gnl/Ergobibamus_cyprinoides/564:15-1685(-)